MRREPEFFEERPLALVFIGKRLDEARQVEQLLTDAAVEYLVEVDYYTGGVIFRRERAGAFIYVEEPDITRAGEAMRARGFEPFEER
jgi:hypothetical protein